MCKSECRLCEIAGETNQNCKVRIQNRELEKMLKKAYEQILALDDRLHRLAVHFDAQ